MTKEALGYINTKLSALSGMSYQYGEYSSYPLPDTYWVGEYTESEPDGESGYEESSFILTGTTRKNYIDLEDMKHTIKVLFPPVAETAILSSGSGIAVSYSDSYPIPSVEEGIRRLQITLKIKEWRC